MKKVSETIPTNAEKVLDTSLKNHFKEENPICHQSVLMQMCCENLFLIFCHFLASHESRHSQKSHKRFTWCSFLEATVMPARPWDV